MALKFVGPVTRTSLVVTRCIALVTVFHGPPLLDQPAQFSTQSSSPSRFASATANLKSSRHSALMKFTGPRGMPESTFTMVAPPRPICFIASRSAVMPSLVMLPFIQCHHVCGLAESGGLRKPEASGSAGAAAAASVNNTAARIGKRIRVGFIRGVRVVDTKMLPGRRMDKRKPLQARAAKI